MQEQFKKAELRSQKSDFEMSLSGVVLNTANKVRGEMCPRIDKRGRVGYNSEKGGGNMEEQFSRTEMLLGEGTAEALARKRVAVFGVGGVGSYVVEALARSGVGAIDLVDSDRVCLSNINRQLVALHSTLGEYKVDVAKRRVLDIFPNCHVEAKKVFFDEKTATDFDFSVYDYVVDAIDTVSGKLLLAEMAERAGVPIISAMGAGNKLDPTAFEVADIFKTSVCPLARVMRHELKKRGITRLKVVYSREEPRAPRVGPTEGAKKIPPASCAFVPSVAGLIIAGEVVKELAGGMGADVC